MYHICIYKYVCVHIFFYFDIRNIYEKISICMYSFFSKKILDPLTINVCVCECKCVRGRGIRYDLLSSNKYKVYEPEIYQQACSDMALYAFSHRI